MKLVFEIEPYEDMVDEPFTTKSYLLDRINIFVLENNKRKEFCTSTFNGAILLDMAEGLIELYEQKETKFTVEMYESTLEYTFSYFQKLLTVTSYEGYNGETLEMMKCRFEDFVAAFLKEYKSYHQYILKQDPHAFENKHYCMMRDQINILNNHLKKLI
ncbi:hypothetical protein [Kurthia zopfii]|uniref:hypothetical protein n=1 Tax=Kurthia zopfii TaxID=1650 RepID=UPI000F6E27F7|nr:hypothetical protein [Kurthia zopfii]VEI06622.1 Uncharacterised protein [Kurthia zopfii]